MKTPPQGGVLLCQTPCHALSRALPSRVVAHGAKRRRRAIRHAERAHPRAAREVEDPAQRGNLLHRPESNLHRFLPLNSPLCTLMPRSPFLCRCERSKAISSIGPRIAPRRKQRGTMDSKGKPGIELRINAELRLDLAAEQPRLAPGLLTGAAEPPPGLHWWEIGTRPDTSMFLKANSCENYPSQRQCECNCQKAGLKDR